MAKGAFGRKVKKRVEAARPTTGAMCVHQKSQRNAFFPSPLFFKIKVHRVYPVGKIMDKYGNCNDSADGRRNLECQADGNTVEKAMDAQTARAQNAAAMMEVIRIMPRRGRSAPWPNCHARPRASAGR